MHNIEVRILNHNCGKTPTFLAKLTQRGHEITNMSALINLYITSSEPTESLLNLPHTTLKRFNHITVAIVGLSTKAVSQLRTHATRMTFLSTSTQYSSYDKRDDNYVVPLLGTNDSDKVEKGYAKVQEVYNQLIEDGVDKDKAGYLLPQGLRKTLIVHGNLDAWQYIMNLRLCRRNTQEVQYIMQMIYKEIMSDCGEVFVTGMLPSCAIDKCKEGKFSCGKPMSKDSVLHGGIII